MYDTFYTLQYKGVYIHARHNRATGCEEVQIHGERQILKSVHAAKCRITRRAGGL